MLAHPKGTGSLAYSAIVVASLASGVAAQPLPPGWAPPAQPPPPPTGPNPIADKALEVLRDHVDDIKRMHDSLGLIVELGYTLATNPGEIERLPSMIYGEFLKAIESDPIMNELFMNMKRQYTGGYVQVNGSAGATSDLAVLGAATAQFDASYELPLCRVAGVNAMGMYGYDDGAIRSYALGGTACLPLPANTVQVSYTRRSNVRGSLLRRPVAFDDRRDEHVVNGLIRFWRYSGRNNIVDVGPITLDVIATESDDGGNIGGQTGSFTAAPVDWRRKGKGLGGIGDQVIGFIKVKAFFHTDDTGIGGRYTSTAAIIPLAIDGIAIGKHVALGVDLGWGTGSVYDAETAAMATDPNVPPPPPLVGRKLVHFETWADILAAPFAGQIKAGHTLLPAYGGQLILEDRVNVRGEIVKPFVAARAEAFIGNARVVRIAEDEFATTYGGAADVAYAIVPNVQAVGRLEVARSIAADIDTEPLRMQREVRATIGITARFDKRW